VQKTAAGKPKKGKKAPAKEDPRASVISLLSGDESSSEEKVGI
jgi:hypothetical protein